MTSRPDTVGPFDARSMALSVLLGSHPPALPARALVAMAELFEIAGGTMRTALSRMVAAGELELIDGRYHLAGRLLERQRSQDIGRHEPDTTWDGTMAHDHRRRRSARSRRASPVSGSHGQPPVRRAAARHLDAAGQPARAPAAEDDWIVTTGGVEGIDPRTLRDRLWPVDELRHRGRALQAALEQIQHSVDWTDATSIPVVFTTSAAVVRFLRAEPLLPPPIVPEGWPATLLRATYDDIEQALQRRLRQFLTANM